MICRGSPGAFDYARHAVRERSGLGGVLVVADANPKAVRDADLDSASHHRVGEAELGLAEGGVERLESRSSELRA
eukprot:9491940-Pyramimonas_sp.AAC.1